MCPFFSFAIVYVLLNLLQMSSSLTPSVACESKNPPVFLFLLPFPVSPRDHTPLPVTLGSSCQMRTLDSGIGTFPLPDSVNRVGSRHLPKSESSPDGVITGSSELHRATPSYPDPSQPDVKVPFLSKTRLHTPKSMGHSLSDPIVTCSSNVQDSRSRLPKLAITGK